LKESLESDEGLQGEAGFLEWNGQVFSLWMKNGRAEFKSSFLLSLEASCLLLLATWASWAGHIQSQTDREVQSFGVSLLLVVRGWFERLWVTEYQQEMPNPRVQ